MNEKEGCPGRTESLDVILRKWPDAMAIVRGSAEYSGINGFVRFYQTQCGVVVAAEIMGLPKNAREVAPVSTTGETGCQSPVFGFHIHENGQCSGTVSNPFADVGSHYNPESCEHPHHAGDMPPLFGNDGYALSVFLTDRFSVSDVIGRAVIIHRDPDDFTTQPSGNSGKMIACGEIRMFRR